MGPIENLHFAIGQLAYAIAFSDGKIQKEEREKFQKIVSEHLKSKEYSFDVSDIVFQIMERDRMDSETAYEWAIKEIRTNSHYLSPELKGNFISVMQKVADAYPPFSEKEKALMDRFKKDIEGLHGDPIYYKK